MTEVTKIFIVDDHPLVLEGLRALIEEHGNLKMVGTAATAQEALVFLGNNSVDVAFLDINLPDISGIDLCKKIKDIWPGIKILALSTFAERSYISRMIQNGAMGYLLKSSSKEEIFEAIDQVMAGGFYMHVNLMQNTKAEASKPVPVLTRRETEILALIAEGLTNPQIADKLFLSTLTINSHRKSLLTKFEVTNTASLIKNAASFGLI
jgi:DNA-binding NarL/FixJ family response regulator